MYVLEVINGPGALTAELDRRLRVFDTVIRHMIVRVDEELAVAERARTRRKAAMADAPRAARAAARADRDRAPAARRKTMTTRTAWTAGSAGARRPMSDDSTRTRGAAAAGRRARATAGDKGAGARTFFRRRRVCKFCVEKIDYISYKDVKLLAPFIPERGKIQPRRISGVCATHQRALQTAIKRARQIALVPYTTDKTRGHSSQPGKPKNDPRSSETHMSIEVILKEHVEHLGRRGEIVKVANGYARNFLFPRKLALAVTDENKRQIERERAKAEAREAEEVKEARGASRRRLEAVELSIARRVGENETLYGSVTSADIADALAARESDRRSPQDPAGRSAEDARRPHGAGEAAPRRRRRR